jgi:hypothetical protein
MTALKCQYPKLSAKMLLAMMELAEAYLKDGAPHSALRVLQQTIALAKKKVKA